jgi:hypothetical protein
MNGKGVSVAVGERSGKSRRMLLSSDETVLEHVVCGRYVCVY